MPRPARTWRAHRLAVVGAVLSALVVAGSPAPASASLIGELSGTVTGGGVPLPNVWVTLTPVSETGESTGNPKRTLTDESGRYEYPEVYDQDIKIHVRAPLFGNLVDTYWPQAFTFAQAGIIEISDWPVTADIDLPVGGSVSGRVVDSATGAAVPEAQVSAVIASSPDAGPVGHTSPGLAPAAFAIAGLPPVPMELRVRLPPTSAYLKRGPGQWQEGVLIDGSVATTDVTVGLLRGAQISGTVRDDRGDPVAGASIKVVGCVPHCPLIATSDASGAYRIVGVTPASRMGVVAWKDTALVRQWYPARDNASQATDLALRAGDELEGIDFALRRAAFMTVSVTAADTGEPLPGAIVLLVSSTNAFERRYALRIRDRPGHMRLGPLHSGSYRLTVMPGRTNPDYGTVGGATGAGGAPGGTIDLGPEDDVDLAVSLPRVAGSPTPQDDARQQATTDPATTPQGGQGARCTKGGAPAPAEGAGDMPPDVWPGLARGFLAPADEANLRW
jgi:hypothetical protein